MPDTIKLSLLSPHPTNPRQIDDRALGGLKRSIKLGMQYLPAGEVLLETIVVNQNGNRILSGHQRVRAMQEEGVAEIAATDVKWVDVVPDSDAESAIVVMLNSQEISGHYTDDLKMFLDDIIANQPELSEELLLKDLLEKEFGGGEGGGSGDSDEIPDPPKEPTTKEGDLWILGNHRLLCGDSANQKDVARLMDEKSVDVLIADPPYGMRLNADYSGMKNNSEMAARKKLKGGQKHNNVEGDYKDFDASRIISNFNNPKEQFWFGADYYSSSLPDTEHSGAWIVWDKRLDESADKMFGSCFELCWSKKKRKREILRIKWAGIFGMEKEPHIVRMHPTQKPVILMEQIASMADGTICDPFSGSGTTLIASEKLGRSCYALEISPAYCDVICQRFYDFTGIRPKRQDGKEWPHEANQKGEVQKDVEPPKEEEKPEKPKSAKPTKKARKGKRK